MALKKTEKRVKPVEEWTAGDWETAYGVLMRKHERLREIMRLALQHLNKAV